MDELPTTLSDKTTLVIHKALQVFGLGEIMELVGFALIFGSLAVIFSNFEGDVGWFISWVFGLGTAGAVTASLGVVFFRMAQRLKRGSQPSVIPADFPQQRSK